MPRSRRAAVAAAAPSVGELIEQGARAFERAGLAYGHGTSSAADDAAALVFHALGLDHAAAPEAYAIVPDATQRERVRALLAERIAKRTPAAYLMGRMWFAGHEFEIDPRVIVPRSPFAELILGDFAPWIDASRARRLLDIGTGSGCIAIACAIELPWLAVDAVDVSPAALDVARRNVARHGLAARVRLLEGDVFGPVAGERYDIIVANPPYVSDAEMARLPGEYLREPDIALRAGPDGLSIVRRILAQAAAHLAPDGVLFVEVGDSDRRLAASYPRVPFTWLEFEHGGGGVFSLTRAQLDAHRADFARAV